MCQCLPVVIYWRRSIPFCPHFSSISNSLWIFYMHRHTAPTCFSHVSPILAKLHWLPTAQRIDYKISSLCYNVVSDTAPLYLSDLLCLYVPSRSLRSSADTRIFRIPTREKKFQGQRAFSHLGPVTWNKLPYSVRHAQTQSQFKTQLKTTLFRSVYEPGS